MVWCTYFITKTEVLFFLICALDCDFWERILSLNSPFHFFINSFIHFFIYDVK